MRQTETTKARRTLGRFELARARTHAHKEREREREREREDKMRESTLLLGYTAQPGVDAVPMQHHQVSQVIVRRTRLSHRRGSGRVTLKRSFALEDHLLSATATATATATNVEMEERKASVEDASVSFQFQQSKPSKNVYQSKRRTRILDRKAGSGRSTSLRLFPLESKQMSPKVLSPEERATNNLCLEIVPYNDNQRAMELDAYASPDAGGFADHEPCFEDVLDASVMQEEEMQEEHVLHEAAAAAAAPVPVRVRKPRGEPHQRLRNYYKNRKSLALHGLKVNEETGLRRSTRRRVKPLQYWRNEKVEYERQHRSLPTIASIALRSPDECWPAPNPRTKRKTKSRIQALTEPEDDDE